MSDRSKICNKQLYIISQLIAADSFLFVYEQIINLGDVRVNRDEKQSDPSVWLDRLAVVFRWVIRFFTLREITSECSLSTI